MDEFKTLEVEFRKLDDLVDTLECKIHNLIGLLELVYLGIKELNKVDDSYELSGVSIIQDYLKSIVKADMPVIHEKLISLKEQV